jgi:hypothetical protein
MMEWWRLMPTVNELRSQIADETGLSTSADTAVLDRALNRAMRRIVSETDCLKGTPAAIAGDGSTVDVSLSTLTGLRSLESVYLRSGASGSYAYSPLGQAPIHAVIGARTRAGASMYAWEGDTLLLDGPAGTSEHIYIRWSMNPTALAAGGAESTVTANGLPIEFHEDLLAGLAMTHILEGYEGNEQRAAYYRQLAVEAMARFKRYLVDRGGDEMPNDRHGASHFHTADPLRSR